MGLSTLRLMTLLITPPTTRLAPASVRNANNTTEGHTPVRYRIAATPPATMSENVITPKTIPA